MVVPGWCPSLLGGLRFGVVVCGSSGKFALLLNPVRGFSLFGLLQFNSIYRIASAICRVLSSAVGTSQRVLVAFWERVGIHLMGLSTFQEFIG